jgi:hypothetical protein
MNHDRIPKLLKGQNMLVTSLYALRHPKLGKDKACTERYAVLRDALGSGYGDKTKIPFTLILEICGLSDTLWAIDNMIDGGDKIIRLFACDCAEHVLHFFEGKYPNDKRVRDCIYTARRFAAGTATIEELNAARAAAWEAARDAARDARAAAWAAAWAAAGDAAGDAAGAAAGAADWAAGAAEEKWQIERLTEYLNESVSPIPKTAKITA